MRFHGLTTWCTSTQLSDVWGLLRLSSVLRLLHTGAGALRNAVGAAVSRPLGAAKVTRGLSPLLDWVSIGPCL
jgi:hypothetical protein